MLSKEINSEIELPVMEQFYTIQGEGFYSGRAAYFIRLAGCDVGCVWCDVKESWNPNEHPIEKIDDLVSKTVQSKTDFCVITGGEPAIYDLTILADKLRTAGIEVAIETSGVHELIGEIDWICFSPKKFKQPKERIYPIANELKVIINHPSDFEWAEDHARRVSDDCMLFLQPEWSKQERFLPMIIEYVKNHPKWRVSLQTHKFMNIP